VSTNIHTGRSRTQFGTAIAAIAIASPRLFVLLILGLLANSDPHALAQDFYWSGQAQCQLSVQSPSYSYQEVQTWILSGTPTMQGAMQVYPGTWSVTGQGGKQDRLGLQTTTIQWTTSVPPMTAPIAVFVRASDNQLIIKSWHAQLRADAAVSGSRQVILAGRAQSPSLVSFPEYEWQFPIIQDAPTSTGVSGTSSTPNTAGIGPMQPAGLQATADCTWQFTKSSNGSQPAMAAPPANFLSNVPRPVSGLTQAAAITSTPLATTNTAVALNPNVANRAVMPSQSALNSPLASALATLPAPASFSATHVGNGVVEFAWQPVSGAAKYRLEGTGISSAGLYVPATSNPSGQGVPPPPPAVQNVPPGPGTWRIASVNAVDKWDANAEATASAMVRYPPPHSPPWLTKSNGPGNPASTLAHYLSLCNQCIPGANFTDVMRNLGLSLDPLAVFPDLGPGCGTQPWCGASGSPWTDDQAARYTNVTEFQNSTRVTNCWTIGKPNGRIVCYAKSSDHGLQVIVKQTDASWFLSFVSADPSFEVFDWVTYDSSKLDYTPLGQRLTSAYTLTDHVSFDTEGAKYPPNACLSCHGGKFTANSVTGTTLLPLDPGLLQPVYGYDPGNVRRVNQAVTDAAPSPAVARYLTGLYGMDPHVATGPGDPKYVPQSWKQQANVYNTAIKPHCMMCHLATPGNLDFTVASNFYQDKDLIYAAVCSAHSMPHAESPYNAFWTKDTGSFFLPGWLAGQLGYQSCP
jgi:hypothetical protein